MTFVTYLYCCLKSQIWLKTAEPSVQEECGSPSLPAFVCTSNTTGVIACSNQETTASGNYINTYNVLLHPTQLVALNLMR